MQEHSILCVHHLQLIQDIPPEVIILPVPGAVHLFLPVFQDKPPQERVVLHVVPWTCMLGSLGLVDSFCNVIDPTKWNRKNLLRTPELGLKIKCSP